MITGEGTVNGNADNVVLKSLTIINEVLSDLGQAIVLMAEGSNYKAIYCKFSSYQDTLFVGFLPDYEFKEFINNRKSLKYVIDINDENIKYIEFLKKNI